MNKTIGIDFESVVSINWRTKSMYGDNSEIPREGAKEFLWELKNNGNKVVIYSTEPNWCRIAREQWLEFYEIPYDEVKCGIKKFDIYIGNEAISFNGDWQEIKNELQKNDRYTNK